MSSVNVSFFGGREKREGQTFLVNTNKDFAKIAVQYAINLTGKAPPILVDLPGLVIMLFRLLEEILAVKWLGCFTLLDVRGPVSVV